MLRSFRLHGAAVYFQDWGLTKALIEGSAREQGISVAQVAMTAEAMIPFFAARLQPKALAEQIVAATQGFLSDPGSISIQSNPDIPIVLGDLIAAAAVDPFRLPALLGLSVHAND